MSIALMTEAWRCDQPTGRKLVLLSLCDNANDQGECYPSISAIAQRCSMTERSVFNQLLALEKSGIISRQSRLNRSTVYTIHPCKFFTPETVSPLKPFHPLPETISPPPEMVSPTVPETISPITIIEPSLNRQLNQTRAKRSSEIQSGIFEVDDVDKSVWQDFVTLRKAKKAPITKTAVDGIRLQAQQAGMTLESALRICCERGWTGFKAAWLADRAGKPGASAQQQPESFRERDARLGRERWEQMTGQTHPDNLPRQCGTVIDITPQFLELTQ